MSRSPNQRPSVPGADIDAMLDAFFDREIDKADAQRLADALREDPRAARNFARTRWVVDSLRRTPESPDFTRTVLGRVNTRRSWLHPGMRRVVSFSRVAAVVALLGMLTIGLVARRTAPETVVLHARPAPLTNVVEQGGVEVADGLRSMLNAMRTVRGASSEAVGALTVRHERAEPAAAPRVSDEWSVIEVRTYIAPLDRPAPQFLRNFPAGDPADARTIWIRPPAGDAVEARTAQLRAG